MIHHDSMYVVEKLDSHFKLKDDSAGDPDVYIETRLRKIVLQNEVEAWIMSPSTYVKESIKNCKSYLEEHFDGKYCLSKKAENPFAYIYAPEVDISEPLISSEASYFQYIIGVMH